MLKIVIPGMELFDERTQEFIYTEEIALVLEHSLVSISKWESFWNKPFLGREEKTSEQVIDYIRCMTVTENVEYEVYSRLTELHLNQISDYINAPMTATTFNDLGSKPSREIITSEIIYYWMVSYNIPFECQYWHLNRLMALIKVCNVKNNPPKKMSKQEIMERNKRLNAERRAKLKSKG